MIRIGILNRKDLNMCGFVRQRSDGFQSINQLTVPQFHAHNDENANELTD